MSGAISAFTAEDAPHIVLRAGGTPHLGGRAHRDGFDVLWGFRSDALRVHYSCGDEIGDGDMFFQSGAWDAAWVQ